MKNLKTIITVVFTVMLFSSCTKESIDTSTSLEEQAKLVGVWQLYRTEFQETIIDEWTGSDWTTKEEWFTNQSDGKIIMDFKADGTLQAKYVDVPFNSGKWTKLSNDSFNIAFDPKIAAADEREQERNSVVTFYCDNTISIISKSNSKNIGYYRKGETKACSDQVPYKTN